MRRKRFGSRAAAALLVAALLSTPTARAARSPTLVAVARQLVQAGAPGAIAVVRTTTSFRSGTAGLARTEPPTPMRVSDRYRVASVTKTFVATVVLQLVAEGKLRLSETVERWLPGLVPRGQAVTLRELLAHTSGLFDFTEDRRYEAARISSPARVWQPRQLVAIAVRHKPLFPPGTDWSYSNTNYVLLGLVVESATGRPLGGELRDRIFRPLHLGSTSYPIGAALAGGVAHGYLGSIPGYALPPGKTLDVTSRVAPDGWGAGQIVSNAVDVTRFYAALLGGRLLPPAQLGAMKTTVRGMHAVLGVPTRFSAPYGLGLFVRRLACGVAYGHDGSLPGYRNVVWANADGSRVATVMANYDASRFSWSKLRELAEQAFCSG